MGKKVSREAGIVALVNNPNVKEAALTCGISERTLHRWLNEPDFATQLLEAQRGITKRVIHSVVSRAERAASVLNEIMCDTDAAQSARVSAARTILEFSFKAIEVEDILKRIEAIEANIVKDY